MSRLASTALVALLSTILILAQDTTTTTTSTTPALIDGNLLDPYATNSTDKPMDVPILPTDYSTSSSSSTATTTMSTVWWSPATMSTSSSAAGPSETTLAAGITGFQQGVACDKTILCPLEAPCCSEKGFCGSGRNCLAGCNPLSSYQPAGCVPVAACQSQQYAIDASRVLTNSSLWTGDAEEHDWLVDSMGYPALGPISTVASTATSYLALSLVPGSNGTVLTSTRSILYGNVTASIKTVAGAGITTGFALVSGTEDEIDIEFTTNATTAAQTSFFYQGDVDGYSSGQQVNISDRSADYHDYTISWTPDAIFWLVDDVIVRNVSKNSTVDSTNPALFHYPQTPFRIQFSIWAAEANTSSQGLLDFVGGPVDWTASSFVQQGYYASSVAAVKVDCYDSSLASSTSASSFVDSAPATTTDSTTTTTGWSPLTSTTISPSESSSSVNASTSSPDSTSPTTTTDWWAVSTPSPTTDVLNSSTTTSTSTITTATSTSWWSRSKVRRRLNLDVFKRDSTAVSYSYGDIDENGQVSVSTGNDAATISSDAATGLDMTGSGSVDSSLSSTASAATSATDSSSASGTATTTDSLSTASTTASMTSSSASATSTSTSKSLTQKWDALTTTEHILIYVAAALVAIFLLVLVGWIWKIAASSRANAAGTLPPDANGAYARIGDAGEMLPTGPIYNGPGEIYAGEELYAGGVAPYGYTAGAAAPPPLPSPLGRMNTASSSGSGKRYENGFQPSSELRKQYGMPAEMRQV